jgi:hypothetical protein
MSWFFNKITSSSLGQAQLLYELGYLKSGRILMLFVRQQHVGSSLARAFIRIVVREVVGGGGERDRER